MQSLFHPFNPIKVLFLLSLNLFWASSGLIFQSYQGSIFTGFEEVKTIDKFNFQSYQGSIFTIACLSSLVRNIFFQSYQGSIFTKNWKQDANASNCLSILSRFYFYWVWIKGWSLEKNIFQSYQGSIFTLMDS